MDDLALVHHIEEQLRMWIRIVELRHRTFERYGVRKVVRCTCSVVCGRWNCHCEQHGEQETRLHSHNVLSNEPRSLRARARPARVWRTWMMESRRQPQFRLLATLTDRWST